MFRDECGVLTNIARRHGRGPRGQRAGASVPFGHWKRLSVLGAIGLDGIIAAMSVEDASHRWNLGRLRPHLNPIEPGWSKVKSGLRRVAARTTEALKHALGPALDSITAHDATGYFRHCGDLRLN